MKRGFTLIELMIGLALSVLIALVVYSGFRVAAQSITQARRVALENQLFGIGLVVALEEVDHWRHLDDPTRAFTPLRTGPGQPAGGADQSGGTPFKPIAVDTGGYAADAGDWRELPQPFTPLAASWPAAGVAVGWDPAGWLPHDPRSWYRGDGANLGWKWNESADERPLRRADWGDYATVGSSQASLLTVGDTAVTMDPVRGWQPSQQRGLLYGLGWYGWFDYLPAGALLDHYGGENGAPAYRERLFSHMLRDRYTRGRNDQAWLASALDDHHGQLMAPRADAATGEKPSLWPTASERVVTRSRMLVDRSVAITAPAPGAGAAERRLAIGSSRVAAGIFGGNDIMVDFVGADGTQRQDLIYSTWEPTSLFPTLLARAANPRDLVDAGPRHWPRISVDVRRVMRFAAVENRCILRAVDPITGEQRELRFRTTGTTLRGARQSRGLDR